MALKGSGQLTLTDMNDVIASPTKPSNPIDGTLWWNTTELKLYVYSIATGWKFAGDGMIFGGRNLIINSDFKNGLSSWSSNGNATATTIDGKTCVRVLGTTNGFYQTPLEQNVGNKFTISFDAKSVSGTSNATIGFLNQSSMQQQFNITNSWTRYSFTTINGLATVSQIFHIYANANTGTGFYITNLKVEKGNIATEWTPALEDTQTQIDTINTTLGNIANDNIIDYNERQIVKDRLIEIMGYIVADATTVLPTTALLDVGTSGKGSFYYVRKNATMAGLLATNAKYIALATAWDSAGGLKTYLEGLTPVKAWDLRTANQSSNITVVKDTWRQKWLDYYKAEQDLANATAEQLKKNVDNVEVGGTNYASNGNFEIDITKSLWSSNYAGGTKQILDISAETPPHQFALYVKNTTNINGGIFTPIIWNGVVAESMVNKEITISYWLKYSGITQGVSAWHLGRFGELVLEGRTSANAIVTSSLIGGTGDMTYVSGTNTTWQKVTVTHKLALPTTAVKLSKIEFKHGLELCKGEFWTTGLKVEIGNKATDWSQSPLDVQDRLNKAELKITDDAIVSTVTGSNSWTQISQKADRISLVVNPDNTIKGDSLVSAINLTPASVKISAKNLTLDGLLTVSNAGISPNMIKNGFDDFSQVPHDDWLDSLPLPMTIYSGNFSQMGIYRWGGYDGGNKLLLYPEMDDTMLKFNNPSDVERNVEHIFSFYWITDDWGQGITIYAIDDAGRMHEILTNEVYQTTGWKRSFVKVKLPSWSLDFAIQFHSGTNEAYSFDCFQLEKSATGQTAPSPWKPASTTTINGNNIKTGSLNASLITTGVLDASKITVTNLVVGQNVSMGTGSFISWNNISDKPSASQIGAISSTYIDANGVWTGSVNANTITSGVMRGIDWVSNSNGTPFNIYIGQTSQLAMQTYFDSFNLWNYATNERYFRVDQNGVTFKGQPLVAKFG